MRGLLPTPTLFVHVLSGNPPLGRNSSKMSHGSLFQFVIRNCRVVKCWFFMLLKFKKQILSKKRKKRKRMLSFINIFENIRHISSYIFHVAWHLSTYIYIHVRSEICSEFKFPSHMEKREKKHKWLYFLHLLTNINPFGINYS